MESVPLGTERTGFGASRSFRSYPFWIRKMVPKIITPKPTLEQKARPPTTHRHDVGEALEGGVGESRGVRP